MIIGAFIFAALPGFLLIVAGLGLFFLVKFLLTAPARRVSLWLPSVSARPADAIKRLPLLDWLGLLEHSPSPYHRLSIIND